MGRNTKPGITFYRMDSGHIRNKKVRLLMNEFDTEGYYIWRSVLDYAYLTNGYFFDLNDKDEFELFASEYCRKKPALIREVIAGCIRRGLFNQTVADLFGILTHEMMQETFIYATADRRSKGAVFTMQQDWLLINFSGKIPPNLEILPGKYSLIPPKNPQTKTETKIKTKKREGAGAPLTDIFFKKNTVEERKELRPGEFSEVLLLFDGTMKSFWDKGKISLEAQKFFNHYQGSGWKINGRSIVDWKAKAKEWMLRELEGRKNKIV